MKKKRLKDSEFMYLTQIQPQTNEAAWQLFCINVSRKSTEFISSFI